MPVASIIIPLFNKEEYVQRSIQSILDQSIDDWECIVVNDGSTDRSPEIVNEFSDPRIRLIDQENKGPGAARNCGISESNTELIAFLDADDAWDPNYLEKQIANLNEHPTAAASVAGYRRSDGSAPKISLDDSQQGLHSLDATALPFEARWQLDTIHSGATIARRTFLEKHGGFYEKDHCTYGEDSYLWLNLFLHEHVYFDHEKLMTYNCDASELGIGRGNPHPVRPILTEATVLIENCPSDKKLALSKLLAYYALLQASELIRRGEEQTGRRLLREFPLWKELQDPRSKRAKRNLLRNRIRARLRNLFGG